jgi:hypothetical protein
MPNRNLSRPDDCLECPDCLDERKSGVDDNVACDRAGGPSRIDGQEGYDGVMFYAPPRECPRWLAYATAVAVDEAMPDKKREYARDAALEKEMGI